MFDHGNLKYQRRTVTGGGVIEIFDDVFTPAEREYHFRFFQQSKYSLGGVSNAMIERSNKTFFTAEFNEEDLQNLKFFDRNGFKYLRNYLDCYSVDRSWCLASSPYSTYYFHPDYVFAEENRKTILYYTNLRWDRDWGGETLFANSCGECEIAVEYKPGRVVVFDSAIEHKPSPISLEADEFRFTFVIQLIRNEVRS